MEHNPRRKYFFFDIDGTLTDRQTGRIVPSAAQAIARLEEAGHFVALCTGRAHYKAEWFRQEHGFDHMVCNGGHGIVIDGDLKENKGIDADKAKAIYHQAQDLGYGILVMLDDSQKVYASDFTFYDQAGERKEPTTYIIDPDFDIDVQPEIQKMYISIPRQEEERLSLKDTLGSLRFVEDYLMFQPDEKKAGILRMLEYVQGDPENVVVFGDDFNDLDMFAPEFYKVAMGNGTQELKDRADYVAAANLDDGIFKACQEHGWFEPVL